MRRDQSFGLEVLFNLGSFGHTGLHHLAGHVLLGAQGRPVRPWDRVLDAAPRPSQLDGHVLGLATVGPGVEQQLVGSGVDHDVPHLQFILGDLLAVVAHQVARVDSRLGEEPGIPDNAHASLHVAPVVGIGIVGDVGIDPLHGPADGFGPIDASQGRDGEQSQNRNCFHILKQINYSCKAIYPYLKSSQGPNDNQSKQVRETKDVQILFFQNRKLNDYIRVDPNREYSRYAFIQKCAKQYYNFKTMNNNKAIPTVVGIDIGTFTTKIAAVQRGAIDIITNEANFRQTPSVVGYGEGERKIGEIGNVKLKSNFKNTVVAPTRFLGLNASTDAGQLELQDCTCNTKVQGDTLLFKVNSNGRDEAFTVEQVLAAFMTKLTFIIEHNNLDDKLKMISVPSCLTQMERKAILNAAEISGMKNVKLVSEAIAIGLDYGSFKKTELAEGRNVLFIDFGHAKLSLSLIKFDDVNMEVLLEKFNRNLGCRDIDNKIFDYMAAKFEAKKGLNVKENKRACVKLIEAIQKQRKILSGISETDISIECLMEDEDFSEHFTRQIMISSAAETFTEINNLLVDFKEELKRRNVKLDFIELVGGGSRIPKFIEIVEQVFEMSSSRTTNSSETIAIGATLAAVKESGLFRFNTLNISNRTALSLKLSWKAIEEEGQSEEYPALNNKTILEFNEKIPTEKTIKIQSGKRTSILISYDLLDQEVEKKLAEVTCEASENQTELNLVFKINEDGFLSLSSVKDNEGKDIKFAVKWLNCLSPEKVAAFKEKEREMFVRDFGIVRSYEKKNELESFIYKQRDTLDKPDFKKYITSEERQSVEKYLAEITEALEDEENKLGIKDYEAKKGEVQKQIKNMEELIKKRKADILVHVKELEKLKTHASDVIKQIQQRYRNSKPVADTCEGIKQVHDWADDLIAQSKKKGVNDRPAATKEQIEEQYETIKMLVDQLINPQRHQQQQQQQTRQQQAERQRQAMLHQQQQQQQQQELLRKQREQQVREQQAREQQRREAMQKEEEERERQQEEEEEEREPRHIRYEQHYDPRYRQSIYDPYQQNPFYSPRQPTRQQQRPQYTQPAQQRRRPQQQQQQHYDPFGMSRSGFFGPGGNMFGNMSGFW